MIQIDEALMIETFDVMRGRIDPTTITKQEVKVIAGLVRALVTQTDKETFLTYDGEVIEVKFFRDWLKAMEEKFHV